MSRIKNKTYDKHKLRIPKHWALFPGRGSSMVSRKQLNWAATQNYPAGSHTGSMALAWRSVAVVLRVH